MVVLINREFEVFIDQEHRFTVEWRRASKRREYLLNELTQKNALILYDLKYWFGKISCSIQQEGSFFLFETVKRWKTKYSCLVGSDLYEIYSHRGTKYSVYKNDIQIAWWDTSIINWRGKNVYKMVLDKDCNYELVISFCLILALSFGGTPGNMLSFNIGNIGGQGKTFDNQWFFEPDSLVNL